MGVSFEVFQNFQDGYFLGYVSVTRSWEQFKEQQRCLSFWRTILILMHRIFSGKIHVTCFAIFFKIYFLKLKNGKRCLHGRKNRKERSLRVFNKYNKYQINFESVKIKKLWGYWKIFDMELKISKVSSMRSKALCVYVSPNQQYGWPLRPHHTLCATD